MNFLALENVKRMREITKQEKPMLMRRWVTLMTFLFLAGPSLSYADKAWDQYLGLSPQQHQQLKAAEQSKKNIVDPARQDKDQAIQNLIAQVLANAGDFAVKPILNQVLTDQQTIDNMDDTFWSSIQSYLSPTQVAKIFLKGHPPKNPSMNTPPPSNPNPPGPHQPKPSWNAYFGFSKDQESQLKADDGVKNASLKSIRAEKDAAIEQLRQLVQSNAADAAIQPTLTTLFKDTQTDHQTDETFWGSTLPGFLNPTQMAELYLHRHAPKGSFNPPLPNK
jgi:F0F1-type ATP synthase membrane subunit b/b'